MGKELLEAVSTAANQKMLLNFQGVSFMSSAMITKLVTLNKTCKAKGVTLKFCEVSSNVMEVFKITKLNKLFDIQAGEEKALASFDKKRLAWLETPYPKPEIHGVSLPRELWGPWRGHSRQPSCSGLTSRVYSGCVLF